MVISRMRRRQGAFQRFELLPADLIDFDTVLQAKLPPPLLCLTGQQQPVVVSRCAGPCQHVGHRRGVVLPAPSRDGSKTIDSILLMMPGLAGRRLGFAAGQRRAEQAADQRQTGTFGRRTPAARRAAPASASADRGSGCPRYPRRSLAVAPGPHSVRSALYCRQWYWSRNQGTTGGLPATGIPTQKGLVPKRALAVERQHHRAGADVSEVQGYQPRRRLFRLRRCAQDDGSAPVP